MISDAESVFQEERASDAPESTVGDDRLAVGQQIGFVHEMRGQKNDLRKAVDAFIVGVGVKPRPGRAVPHRTAARLASMRRN